MPRKLPSIDSAISAEPDLYWASVRPSLQPHESSVFRRRLFAECLEPRQLLAADASLFDPNVLDVNGDGSVTDADSQTVLVAIEQTSDSQQARSDVNGDGRVTALDLLRVINEVGRENFAEGESGPLLSIVDAQVTEGDNGTTILSFDVNRSQVTNGVVRVDATVSNGSAKGLVVERVANGLTRPVFATYAPGEPDKLFVVEQDGHIELLDLQTNTLAATRFLTITDLTKGGERGLLGLAFHPDYQNNGLLYVNMTDAGGDTLIREYTVNPGGDTADPTSARTILNFDQPFSNHNGGWIGFGPDGYLYIGSGDGGSGNDPQGHGQDTTTLLGAMLRIDVDGDDFASDVERNYAIPPSNPFVGVSGADEIWSYGLRNPWRASFDRETGDLYIGDVGQNAREEIDFQPASSAGGENYGWKLREGLIATPSVGGPAPPGAIEPIHDFLHANLPDGGFSVSGGYVYRGPIPELRGHYFFADYVFSRVWSLRFNGDDPSAFNGENFDDFTFWDDLIEPDVGAINRVSSFGEDLAGNLYIVDHLGELFRISEGADYLQTTETLVFQGGVTNQTFEVEIMGDRLPEGSETVTVTLSNPVNSTIVNGTAVGTILDNDTPQIKSVAINQGDEQRSSLTEIQVTFDSPVAAPASAFQIMETESMVVADSVQVSSTVVNQETVSVLTFTSGNLVDNDSLNNGSYQLTIDAALVAVPGGGLGMDSDFEFGDEPADAFFRKYGDQNGNGIVELIDFSSFRQTFGLVSGDAGYLPEVDSDSDGVIGLLDFAQFRAGFGS